ncbi:MAG: PTS system mannose/fructose/sorbose family transporter subunit IID [Mycoplasmatales bacterium]
MVSKQEWHDMSKEKVITKKDLNKMAWRSLFLQASFNFERMQACGWLFGLIPGLKKIHKNKKDMSESMNLHMEFFNVHPFLVTFVQGIVVAMEEAKENRETIRAIKIALMGPLGGIGDALFWFTLLPISASIGCSLALEGSVFGPIVFLVMFNVVHFGFRFGLIHYAYKMGVSAISKLKEGTESVTRASIILGLTVVGALIASFVKLSTVLAIKTGELNISVQTGVIDLIMPNLLPLLYTFVMYKMLKKGKQAIHLIIVTLIFAIIGKYLGIL